MLKRDVKRPSTQTWERFCQCIGRTATSQSKVAAMNFQGRALISLSLTTLIHFGETKLCTTECTIVTKGRTIKSYSGLQKYGTPQDHNIIVTICGCHFSVFVIIIHIAYYYYYCYYSPFFYIYASRIYMNPKILI